MVDLNRGWEWVVEPQTLAVAFNHSLFFRAKEFMLHLSIFGPEWQMLVQIVQPFAVGSAKSGSGILPEVDDQPQPAGNLFISLKANQQVKARRSIIIEFRSGRQRGSTSDRSILNLAWGL